MNSFDRADPTAAARIAALLPELHTRYTRLRETLSRASAGEDIPDWQLDIQRADLLAVLDGLSPGDEEEL